MDGVKKTTRVNHANAINHSRMQKSVTLNRKFVKKPVSRTDIKSSVSVTRRQPTTKTLISKQKTVQLKPVAKVSTANTLTYVGKPQSTAQAAARIVAKERVKEAQKRNNIQRTQVEKVARARMSARQAAHPEHMTAQEMKDRAIKQALSRVSKMETEANQIEILQNAKLHFWQKKSFMAASAMAVIAVTLMGYLAYLNLPDLSVRVAAMQAGIEKSTPSHLPDGYKLDGLATEDGDKVMMNFKNSDGQSFTLTEEKSSWDSAAVIENYVEVEWPDYSIAKGQGLTIFINESNAAWVNGGIFYLISGEGSQLSASELYDIAISL